MAIFSAISLVTVSSLVVEAGAISGLAEGATIWKIAFIFFIGYFIYAQKPKNLEIWKNTLDR